MKFIYVNQQLQLLNDEDVIGTLDFLIKDEILAIIKVQVDPSYRGQGLAQKLMEEIISFAKKNNYEIEPICSYAVKYLEKNN